MPTLTPPPYSARQQAARNAGTVPHVRVTLPSGHAGLAPVWLPVRGTRSGGTLALHLPTLGAMPTRGARP